MDKYSLPVCTEVFSASIEKPVSFEDILPEYCPGIRKILKADASVKAADTNFSGGIIDVSSPCEIRVLYLADNGALKSVSFSHHLDFAVDASKMSEAEGETRFFARICIPRAYAKNKSARSMEIKLDSLVSINACTFDAVKLFESDMSDDTETKRSSTVMTERIITEKRDGEISDTITLDATLPAAAEIIDYSVFLSDYTAECSNGMLTYKGNAVFKCTYKASLTKENGENEYIYLKKSIPFEGEITHDGITEKGRCVPDITAFETDINLSADPYGENRIIDISIFYCTHAEIFCDKDAEFTYDGFCSSYECEFETTQYCFDSFSDTINRSYNLSESIPLNGVSLTEITDTELKLGNYSTELHEGKIFVSAKAYAVITGSDANGEPCCIDHRFTIKQCIDDTGSTSDRKYIVCCNASPGEATLKDGELSLEYTLKTDGAVLEKNTVKAISGARIFYDKPKPLCRSEYIIYYPDKKETLWDIAKKYEIPQKKLADANGITEEQTLNKKTVLIPCII